MNRSNIFKTITILLCALAAFSANSQQVTRYQVSNGAPGEYQYMVQGLVPSQTGAFFSHLWWFGDNGFRFNANPSYAHDNPTQNTSAVSMISVTTENYGTGGPPPLPYSALRHANTGSPIDILQPGNSIYLQKYRNAVANDTMYLILTYKNTTSPGMAVSGTLRLELDQNLQFISSFANSHPTVYPNNEQNVNGQPEWTFNNLKYGRERSILIPVYVSPNAEGNVNIKAILETSEIQKEPEIVGVNVYNIAAPVELSHDPNMMSETSDEIRLCTTREDTISYHVKFQNTGEAPTRYVKVTCTLDDKVDLNSISNIELPEVYQAQHIRNASLQGYNNTDNSKWVNWTVDHSNRTVTFEMNMMVLAPLDDNCVDLETTRSELSFKVNVKSNYVFGPAALAHSSIIFDKNDPILTDTVSSTCVDPIPIGQGGGFQTPEPASYPTWWYVVGGVVVVLIVLVAVGVMRRRN